MFVIVAIHQSLPLPLFYPRDKDGVFPNGWYTFTFLPDGCQETKLQISYEGEKLHTALLLHRKSLQTDKQPELVRNSLASNNAWVRRRNERGERGRGWLHREKKVLYLGCWTGCQWQRFHSTPRRGRPVGHWCHCPRSRTETDRETEKTRSVWEIADL